VYIFYGRNDLLTGQQHFPVAAQLLIFLFVIRAGLAGNCVV
jgi:hypothetical protein